VIAIVDYGMGNKRSVEKALEHVGAQPRITAAADEIRAADAVILPGVGAFPEAMRRLRAAGLDGVVRERAAAGVPLLGICLGMQLLFGSSTEHEGAEGLGLLEGEVTALRAPKLPHIGWNEVRFERPCALTAELPSRGCPFYHVHSFAARPRDPGHVAGSTEYGERFATIAARENVLGVQFHPEKSSRHGLRMLQAFVGLCAARSSRVAA
jgi:glutamine amidotransferase